jgi:ferrous iron transport protein A
LQRFSQLNAMKVRIRQRSVADLVQGERGIIKALGDDLLALKLLEMGCLPGTEVCLEHRVSAKGPLCIKIGGRALSLRCQEAEALSLCE